jgi:hypothetical protein
MSYRGFRNCIKIADVKIARNYLNYFWEETAMGILKKIKQVKSVFGTWLNPISQVMQKKIALN